jgi:hypothetical protein
LEIDNDLAAGEGVEPSSSSSKPDVLPVAPSRNALAICDCQLPIERRNAENQLAMTLVAVAGIEPGTARLSIECSGR